MRKIKIYDVITEQLVREVFFHLSKELGFTVLSSRTEFPDYILLRDGDVIRAEAEVLTSNFYLHKHHEKECDMIICYEDDLQKESHLEILELKQFIEIGKEFTENKIVLKARGIDEVELVVRLLAEKLGRKFSPNGVTKAFQRRKTKIHSKKATHILQFLSAVCGNIYAFEKFPAGNYYWIKADKDAFKNWFKEWFGKDF